MVHRPNPVQTISQQLQHFGQRHQISMGPRPAPPPEQMIQTQVQELALEIYSRIVAGKHLDASYTSELDQSQLRKIARDSQAAATAYFAQLGVQFEDGQKIDAGSQSG